MNFSLYLILFFLIVTYFAYCYELSKCCQYLGLKAGAMCWIPYLNKYKLVQIEDFDGDGKMSIPLIHVNVPRWLIASMASIIACLAVLLPMGIVVCYVLLVVSNLLIWNEINSETHYNLGNTGKGHYIDNLMCAVLCLHVFQWISLFSLRKSWNNVNVGETADCEDREYEYDTDVLFEGEAEPIETEDILSMDEQENVEEKLDADFFDNIFQNQ